MKLPHIIILSIFLFAIIAGCVEHTKADSGRITEVYSDDALYGFSVYHDNVNNVTIYYSNSHGAIAAVPDYQLKQPVNYTRV